MTEEGPIEKIINDLEGATQALNNFASSAELTTETEYGLKWLAMQIDGYMVDLRNHWDAEHKPPLKAVKE